MGPWMMGPGYGYGYGMGPGMMGPGYGRGYGMGPWMMGPGYGHGRYGQSEECQKFLDDSAGLRKELYNKRFEYFETMRNPQSTPESVEKLAKEISELQEKIYSDAPQGCW